MKPYCRKDEAYFRLRDAISTRVQEQIFLLPAERILSREIGVSRMTLRKALVMAEEEGLICREYGKTRIPYQALPFQRADGCCLWPPESMDESFFQQLNGCI